MSFKDIEIKSGYRSKSDDIIEKFYIPILSEAVLYQRAVGYFSSSALLALSRGICGLVKNEGCIQLITSPRLSQEDIDAIYDGLKQRDEVIKEALLRELREPKEKEEEDRFNLLSHLIASGKLEIKVAFFEEDNKIQMYHEKIGLMHDVEGNIIAFSGSMNETSNAFVGNYESIDVYASWRGKDKERVDDKHAHFNSMWGNDEREIKVMKFEEIDKEFIKKYQKNSKIIDTTLDDKYLRNRDREEGKDKKITGPYLPESVKLRPYQEEAIKKWANNNYRGIFDMATGTGKTYTALAAVADLFKKQKGKLAVIIVCPLQTLLEQWTEDIIAFGMEPIVCAYLKQNWKEKLATAVVNFNLGNRDHFCMVSTNKTFANNELQKQVKKLKKDIVLVVDEAHNFGAEKLSESLPEHIPFRLALSATIERHRDPEGTQKLYDYFGKKCIEYTIKQAIEEKMLTPYSYFPIEVFLTEDEFEEYLKLTKEIRTACRRDKDGKTILSEKGKKLLIKRAYIVAGAEEKITKLRELIEERGYKDKKHILVYCGATTIHDVNDKDGEFFKEGCSQINVITDMLGNDLKMKVSRFTSKEAPKEREKIKKVFAEGKQQALVAIRCLDEGVNIPSIKTAFILASSTNPKEYIQRRGRVLRQAEGKKEATIFDFITLPIPFENLRNYEQEEIDDVKSLARREIKRMKEFKSIAKNQHESDSLIYKIQGKYDIETNTEEDEDYEEYI